MKKFALATIHKVANLKNKVNHAMIAGSVALMTTPALAREYDVSDLVDEFDAGEAPVATMASASIELLIIRRIWKIIQKSV